MRDDNEYSKYDDLLSKLVNSQESPQLDVLTSEEPLQFDSLPVDDNGYTKNVLMEGIPGMSDIGAPTRENLNPIPLRNDTPLDMNKLMQPRASQTDLAPSIPAVSGLPKAQKTAPPIVTAEVPALPSTPPVSPIDELKAAQEQRNSELNNLAIFRGLMNVGQGLAYQKYDPTIGKDFETIANNKVADVMQRKEAQAKDIDFKKAALQLKNSEAEGDPKSEVSKALREAIKMRYKSIGHPININDNLSAAQLKTMYPSGDLADDFLKMDALRANKIALAEAKKDAISAGEKAVDKNFAEDYNNYTQGGLSRAADDINNLKEMRKVVEQESKSMISAGGGPISGSLPDALRSEKSIAIRDNIIKTANTALKATFGGNLSNDERQAAAKEFYNDKLGPEENLKIMDSKIKELETARIEKLAKIKYYEDHDKSLKGFKYSASQASPSASEAKTNNIKTNKPKTVTQNGHTYTFNESTGTYE